MLNRDRFNGSKEAKFPRSQVHCLENAPTNAFTIYSKISQLLRSPYEIILVWPELNARPYGEIAHKMTTWVFCTNSQNAGVTLHPQCLVITIRISPVYLTKTNLIWPNSILENLYLWSTRIHMDWNRLGLQLK